MSTMLTATGHIRYGPQSPSLPRKGWWLLVQGDPDWFRLYGKWAHRNLPYKWIRAVDRDRIFNSRSVDLEPRLAIQRPTVLPPAWGPHISVARNEHPKANRDLWVKGVEIGDMLSRQSWMQSQGRATGKLQRGIDIKMRSWCRLAQDRRVPLTLAPGAEVEFTFNVEAQTNGHHWWFTVNSPMLSDIRETFGLARRPRVPFHLTFAVREEV